MEGTLILRCCCGKAKRTDVAWQHEPVCKVSHGVIGDVTSGCMEFLPLDFSPIARNPPVLRFRIPVSFA